MIDKQYALNLSVVCPQGENIGWWSMETDPDWWGLRLWIGRN